MNICSYIPIRCLDRKSVNDRFKFVFDTVCQLQGGVPGGGTVTSFSFIDGDGFEGIVTNPTSTPSLSLTTSVADTEVMYSTSGAITGSVELTLTSISGGKSLNIGTSGPSSNGQINLGGSGGGVGVINFNGGPGKIASNSFLNYRTTTPSVAHRFYTDDTILHLTIDDDGLNLAAGNDLRLNGSAGSIGEVLTSAGAGALPTWSPGYTPPPPPDFAVLGTDVIDIRAFGAVPDGTTDCAPALVLAKAAAPAGALIWLKNRGTGVYRFNNSSTSLFENCQLYIEDNVVVSLMQGTAININSVTPFTLRWEVLGDQENTLYPNNPLRDTLNIETLKDEVIVRETFDANDFTEDGFGSWTEDGTRGSIPGNLAIGSVKELTLTGITPSNALRAAVTDPIPGGTISACARNTTTGFGVLWVENAFGVAVAVDGGDYSLHKIGDPGFSIAYTFPPGYPRELKDNGSYLNYNTSKAVCAIKLHEDGIHFEFLYNGVNMTGHIGNINGQPITKWGFGGYNVAGSGTSVTWYDFIVEYKRKKEPFEDIVVQIFGDSQSVEYSGQSWMTLFQAMINNSYGNRVTKLTNYAISGQTIAQQKTVFDATTHEGITIFFAGTNDIQGQTSITTMLTNLDSILADLDFTNIQGASTVGVSNPGKNRLLLVIPPMYFSQALNGGQGQASSNYELGGAYRMAMLRWAAENDVVVADLMTALGATTMNSNTFRDDIHFVDLGAAIAAKEIAKQFLILQSKVNANTVIVGDSKSTLHIIKEATPPADTSTIVKWINVYLGGVEYKMPLYL